MWGGVCNLTRHTESVSNDESLKLRFMIELGKSNTRQVVDLKILFLARKIVEIVLKLL